MRGKMDCHGMTDHGKKREVNDDQFMIADLCKSMLIHQTSLSHEDHSRLFGGSQGKMLVVADGFGSRREGERASALAIDALARYVLNTMEWFLQLQQGHEDDLKEELKSAMEQCQETIEVDSSASFERFGMGSTLTMAYITWPRLYVVHVGECRCYLFRDSKLEQITRDQNEAQQLVERGVITPEEAAASRFSHVLWNYLGGGTPELNPEVYKATLAMGDTLLLCTDGLTKCLHDAEIAEILGQNRSAEDTGKILVDRANRCGGPDNITVIVGRFLENTHEQAVAEAAAAAVQPTQVVLGRKQQVTSALTAAEPHPFIEYPHDFL
jgi:serine/threonine protein phosphatase PrpC